MGILDKVWMIISNKLKLIIMIMLINNQINDHIITHINNQMIMRVIINKGHIVMIQINNKLLREVIGRATRHSTKLNRY